MSLDWAWSGLVAGGAVLEIWAILRSRDGVDRGTLSRLVRRTFRTHCRVGRTVFAATWTAFAAWFLRHVLRQQPSPELA